MQASGEDKVKRFMAFQFNRRVAVLIFLVFVFISLAPAQQAQPAPSPDTDHNLTDPAERGGLASSPEQAPASISGSVVDPTGASVPGARITLTASDQSTNENVLSGTDGQFFFPKVTPGNFKLTISFAGFSTQTFSGSVHPGEVQAIPEITLKVEEHVTEVRVGVNSVEVAEEQMKIEEKQRVLGVIPNFYVTYIPNAAPLTPRQKFHLALRTIIDPFTFVVVGGTAGVEQAQNHFAGYGQGAAGYAKRFGANYADATAGTIIGGAILPSILKQDPRYFYKGTGSKTSRLAYAIANSVICKGDNGRWQPNYSNVLGSLAAGGISNLYYPDQDRNGVGLTFENAAIGIASTAVTNILQEFIIRKLTPKLPSREALQQ
jgi:Carboxypeptidase regulatory-like domain